MVSVVSAAILLLVFAPAGGPLVFAEARECVRPRGRHRRLIWGRHAARGGRR
jgi:hypothetical protein